MNTSRLIIFGFVALLATALSVAAATALNVSLLFTWDCDSTPIEYRVYQKATTSTTGVVSWNKVATVLPAVVGTAPAKTATLTNVAPGAYTFRISAVYPSDVVEPFELFSPDAPINVPALYAPGNGRIKIIFSR